MAKRRAIRAGEISSDVGIDLSRLAGWINQCLVCEAPVPRAILVRDDALALDVAERCAIFRHAGLATSITCTACDDAHASNVIQDFDGGFSHSCLFNGRIDLAKDEVSLLRFDRAALLVALMAAAEIPRRDPRWFAKDRLASLGVVLASHGSQDWVLGYADQLEDENVLAGVTDALVKQFPDGPGLIITPSPVNLNAPLPRHYRLAGFRDLLFGAAAGIAFNQGWAEILLGHRKRTPGQPGRPSELEATTQLWLAAQASPDWPTQRNEQAKIILSNWTGRESPPAIGTIKNHLRRLEREAGPMAIGG